MPCLNEHSSVAGLVSESFAMFRRIGLAGEVVVCDNGSTDGSGPLAEAAGAKVVREESRGYGRSVRTGLNAATGRFIAVLDADGSYDPHDLGALLGPLLAADADFVRGCRFAAPIMPGTMPFSRRWIGNPALTAALRLVSGTTWQDGQSGMWAITAKTYRDLRLAADGMEFAHEVLFEVQRVSARTAEIPIAYRPRHGRSKLRPIRDGLRHLTFLYRRATT
jgi:glycosyltransferase involved in cell wall biosynthesis